MIMHSLGFFKSLYYEFLSYFVAEKLYFEVEGKCKKCGKCCRNIYAVGMESEKDLKIMQFIFPSYRNFYIKDRDEKGNLIFACKFIGDDGLCTIYDKRPSVCRRYPASRIRFKAPLPDYCGFRLKNIDFRDYIKKC